MPRLLHCCCFVLLTTLASAQNLHFEPADPQPLLNKVYTGSLHSTDIDNDGDLDLVQSGIGVDAVTGTSAMPTV